jgi:FKBP-type peptidyl-prolyl cis-trans isomerase
MLRKALIVAVAAIAVAACDNAKNEQTGSASAAPSAENVVTGTVNDGGTSAATAAVAAVPGTAEAKPEAAATPKAADQMSISTDAKVTTKSGLKYTILVPGKKDAKEVKAGDTASVHYTGWLPNGKKFDSSLDRNQPFPVTVGRGDVIKGWDEGLQGMKVGEKRKLVIPPDLGYADRAMGDIPANSTLIFEVEVLDVK